MLQHSTGEEDHALAIMLAQASDLVVEVEEGIAIVEGEDDLFK